MIATMAIAQAPQQRDSVKLSADFPVPAWPADGIIPPELKSHYVFIDVAKNEYVVAYPQNLGAPNFEKDGPGERQVNRYKLQRDVDPAVAVAVSPSNGGRFKYAYTVLNGPKAKQSIDQWALVLPDTAAGTVTKPPSGWFGIVQKGRKLSVANSDWIRNGTAVVFSFEKPAEQIQPGSIKTGFELDSDLKPGFSIGFFRQAESVEAVVQTSGNIPRVVVQNATPPAPPAGSAPPEGQRGFGGAQIPAGATTAWQPIKDEIDKLLQFEYNSKPMLILAPKFDKASADKTVAADFLQGITLSTRIGLLSADSQFVKAALNDLDGYIKAGGSGQLQLTAQPKGDAETQIFNAMKLSLHLN